MSKKILVAVAWPYVNGEPHLGHIAGMNVPADIFARYHRIVGNKVAMVSGSDMHGTPTALKAADEGVEPSEVAFKFHKIWKSLLEKMGFSYDLYTHTHTKNHEEVVSKIFLKLQKRGLLYEKTHKMPFSLTENRFLPDRFVEGTCPQCSFSKARGDQCEQCGRTLDPTDLINIKSIRDNSTPEFRETTHQFFKLSKYNKILEEWISKKDQWRINVKNQSIGMLREGLKDRAITRDIEWGIPIPIKDGYKTKRIYVWFEAVIGYLSATVEWAKIQGDENLWEEFWLDKNAESYYFQGKDNIPFHAIIWPAILLGYENHNLPTDVVANEYLNLGGLDFSKSKGHAIWLSDYLKRYEPEPLRYYLTSIMPETSDSEFTWAGFVASNNNELVATLGNFIHRVLTISNKNFDFLVKPKKLNQKDREILQACDTTLSEVSNSIKKRKFRLALQNAMNLAHIGNKYIDDEKPWATVKINKTKASNTLWVGINIISTLRTVFYPFLPKSSDLIHKMLNFEDNTLSDGWKRKVLPAKLKIDKPTPLFQKLDEEIIIEENNRLLN
ncbi:MAG: methionine--tRNA ligase [Chloroflexi bacterium]|nr:methionine--tRNA ligase [Chloroflexota bacterium]